jgi:hypothetical protein
VAPQRRTPAASTPDRRDNNRRDQVGSRAPAQGAPGRAGVSAPVLQRLLEDWRARTQKAKKPRSYSLVYRYKIKNGLPVRLLDNDDPRYDPDKDRDGIVDEDFNPPHEVWDVSRPGGYVIPVPLKPGMPLPINDHSFLPKRGNTAVIGRLVDTAKWSDTPGYDVLNVPDWTLRKNDMWLNQVIHNRQTVYVATPPTPENRWDSVKNRPTVFGREIKQLQDAGYTWDGDFLRPPPRPQARPGGRLLPPPGRR